MPDAQRALVKSLTLAQQSGECVFECKEDVLCLETVIVSYWVLRHAINDVCKAGTKGLEDKL